MNKIELNTRDSNNSLIDHSSSSACRLCRSVACSNTKARSIFVINQAVSSRLLTFEVISIISLVEDMKGERKANINYAAAFALKQRKKKVHCKIQYLLEFNSKAFYYELYFPLYYISCSYS